MGGRPHLQRAQERRERLPAHKLASSRLRLTCQGRAGACNREHSAAALQHAEGW